MRRRSNYRPFPPPFGPTSAQRRRRKSHGFQNRRGVVLDIKGIGMRLTLLIAVIVSILPLACGSEVRPSKKSPAAPAIRSLAANEIEDATQTGAVGPGAVGPRVARAQILLDRARFSPGE